MNNLNQDKMNKNPKDYKIYGMPLERLDKKFQKALLKESNDKDVFKTLLKVEPPIIKWKIRKDGAIIIPELKGWKILKFRMLFWYYKTFKKVEVLPRK